MKDIRKILKDLVIKNDFHLKMSKRKEKRKSFMMKIDIEKIDKLEREVKKKLLGLRDFEGAYIISRLVGNKKKILIVGCLWGRDYHFLNALGKEIVNLDLGKQNVPNLVIGDITKKQIFKNETFDAVIMGEIIEHIFEDLEALKEVRRILKRDGKLIITIPYYDDHAEYHVRMHTQKTMKRLLEHSGFRIERVITRGGLLISLSKIFAIPSLILSKISLKLRINYLKKISEMDYKLGQKNRWFFKLSKSYGGYFIASKGNKKNFVEVNRKAFIPLENRK